MKNLIRATMLAALLLACGSPLAQVPIIIGPQPPPHVIHVLPPRPGPEFVWVGGYWYPVGQHYMWHEGIGLAHRSREPIGLYLVTMEGGISAVTGTETAADLNMTTAGTTIGIAITTTAS